MPGKEQILQFRQDQSRPDEAAARAKIPLRDRPSPAMVLIPRLEHREQGPRISEDATCHPSSFR